MKKEIQVEVRTASQCSFIPFTVVPDSWKGRTVRVVLEVEETGDLPWTLDDPE